LPTLWNETLSFSFPRRDPLPSTWGGPVPFEQLVIGGTYWPPFLAELGMAIVIFLLLRILLKRIRLYRLVWHPALVEVALFTCILSVIVLVLTP
jgi:hypothetical protein